MNKKEIDKLLKRKRYTGKEVGKALVAVTVDNIHRRNEANIKPIIAQSELGRMKRSLNTIKDLRDNEIYEVIAEEIQSTFDKCMGIYQQFYNGHFRYRTMITDASKGELAYTYADAFPLVFTLEDAQALKEKTLDRVNNTMATYGEVFFAVLQDVLDNPAKYSQKMEKAIDNTLNETATNKDVLMRYKTLYGSYRYVFEDGTSTPANDPTMLIKKKDVPQFLLTQKTYKGYELFFKGEEEIKRLYNEATGDEFTAVEEQFIMQALSSLAHYTKQARVQEFLDENMHTAPFSLFCKIMPLFYSDFIDMKWNLVLDPIKEVSKHEILISSVVDYYQNHIDQFKEDYPEIYKEVRAVVKELCPNITRLGLKQLNTKIITWKELADAGLDEYISKTALSNKNIADTFKEAAAGTPADNYLNYERLLRNGIVIADNPQKSLLNKDLHYIDGIDYLLLIHKFTSVDSLDRPNKIEEARTIRDRIIISALTYLYSFNALLDIIGEVYEIDDIDKVKIDMRPLEESCEEINKFIYLTYEEVYGSKEDKQRKRDIIKKVFKPIDYNNLKPTENVINNLKNMLSNSAFTTDAYRMLSQFNIMIDSIRGGES